jgi:hypothetical protein
MSEFRAAIPFNYILTDVFDFEGEGAILTLNLDAKDHSTERNHSRDMGSKAE